MKRGRRLFPREDSQADQVADEAWAVADRLMARLGIAFSKTAVTVVTCSIAPSRSVLGSGVKSLLRWFVWVSCRCCLALEALGSPLRRC